MKTLRCYTPVFACVAITLALVTACGAAGPGAYGRLDSSDSSNSFNLDDIQPDWGPKEDVFGQGSVGNPQLNRLEHNGNVVGDNERQFFAVRKYSETDTQEAFSRKLQLVAGEEYQGYIFFHNSSPPNVMPSLSNGTSVALSWPSIVSGKSKVEASLFAKNAVPSIVTSSVVLSTAPGSGLSLDFESASVLMRGGDLKYDIPKDKLTSDRGALVGCSQPDGYLTSNNDCWGQVLFTFRALQNSYILQGVTAPTDIDDFSNYIEVGANTGWFRVALKYINTGKADQENVYLGHIAADDPNAIDIDPQSYKIKYDNSSWQTISLDERQAFNVSEVRPGEVVIFSASVRVSDWSKLCNRGVEHLYVSAEPDNFSRSQVAVAFYPDGGKC